MTHKLYQTLSKVMGAFLLPLFCVAGSLFFTSCEETTVIDEYANWKIRNAEFIDSIATVTKNDTSGEWIRILSFNLNDTTSTGEIATHDNEDYIYCQIIEQGTGTKSPVFTDSVLVNYRGRLIPTISYPEGKVFDQSYKGAFNPSISVPAKFSVGGVIVGWSTALQHMVKGDIWRVYIPANLAYGSSKQTDIPAYSTLIFDMNLAGFYPIGTPVPEL